jgi:hypothetical protein
VTPTVTSSRSGRADAECQLGLAQTVTPDLTPDSAAEAQQAADRLDMGSAWPETGLVFTTRTGRPVEPRYLVRSFRRICDNNGIRAIKVHHLRHAVGSLLKDLKVPARDVQTILGHTRISTTLEIYTDTHEAARRDALTRLHDLLDDSRTRPAATGSSYSRAVPDLGNRCFGWRAWQDSNLRPAA